MAKKKRVHKRLTITQKMEKIRDFVDFDFKHPKRLSGKNKNLIYRHYRTIEALQKNYHLHAIKNPFPTQFSDVQNDLNREFKSVAGYQKHTRFKVIWTPNDLEGADINYDAIEQKFVFSKMGASIYSIYFTNRKELLENTRDYVEEKLSSVPESATIRPINPQGPFGSTPFGGKGGRYDKRALLDEIQALYDRYTESFNDFMEGVEVTQF